MHIKDFLILEPRMAEHRPAPMMQNAQTNTTARSNPISQSTGSRNSNAAVQSEQRAVNRSKNPNPGGGITRSRKTL